MLECLAPGIADFGRAGGFTGSYAVGLLWFPRETYQTQQYKRNEPFRDCYFGKNSSKLFVLLPTCVWSGCRRVAVPGRGICRRSLNYTVQSAYIAEYTPLRRQRTSTAFNSVLQHTHTHMPTKYTTWRDGSCWESFAMRASSSGPLPPARWCGDTFETLNASEVHCLDA